MEFPQYQLNLLAKMQQNIELNNEDDNVVNIFVPMAIKRRGSLVTVIVKNTKSRDQDKNFKSNMIKSFAKAYKWKKMLESGDIKFLSDISRKENITTAYISKIYNLNFISPKIVKAIFNGEQPRDLRLQDMTRTDIPLVWEEQEEKWGF